MRRPIIQLSSLLLLALPFGGFGEETHLINGHYWSDTQLEEAYLKVVREFGADPYQKKAGALTQWNAMVLEGPILKASPRHVIVDSLVGPVAIRPKRAYTVGSNEQVFAARKIGQVAYEDETGHRMQIPEFQDLTLSRPEFVHYLRQGMRFRDPDELRPPPVVTTPDALPPVPAPPTTNDSDGFRKGEPGSLDERSSSGLRRAKPGELDSREGSNFRRGKPGELDTREGSAFRRGDPGELDGRDGSGFYRGPVRR